MKEKATIFTVNGKEYKAIFNLNVMQSIQVEYGTFESWGELTDGFVYDENGERKLKLDRDGNPITKEVDIKALIFGIKEMINEAIDIDNENNQLNQPLLTEQQVGRLITAMGIEKATSKLNETVIESTKDDTPKNE